jgi:hypothetical protein
MVAIVDAERPDLLGRLGPFPLTSPAFVRHAGDLARVDWPVIAECWHCLMFARMLRPAPAGSMLPGLPQRELLELMGGAVHPHAHARFGGYSAALVRGPVEGVFAFCLCDDWPGPTSLPALYLYDDSPGLAAALAPSLPADAAITQLRQLATAEFLVALAM